MRPLAASACLTLILGSVLLAAPARADDPTPTFADRSTKEVSDLERSIGFLLNPLDIAQGVYGGDVDLVLGRHLAVSIEGDVYANVSGTTATAFGAGLLFYPKVAFEGLYLEPRVAYARPLSEGLTHFDWGTDAFGFGATAGWQWTWDYGFTVRLGGGGMYFVGGQGSGSTGPLALSGPQLVMDGSIGWVF